MNRTDDLRASTPTAIEIHRIVEDWAAAVNRRDIEGVVRSHADDIRLFDVVPPLQTRGLEPYRASWEAQFFPWMGEDGHFRLEDVDVVAGERVGCATGIIDCAGREHGRPATFRVRVTVVLERREGRWVVVHEHHSEPTGYR